MQKLILTMPVILAAALPVASIAATVKGDAMACPSIDAWERVEEALHSQGGSVAAAVRAGDDAGCVKVPKGTTVSIEGTVGPLSRVQAPNGATFYFTSKDLR
jgi:hypothetical protein